VFTGYLGYFKRSGQQETKPMMTYNELLKAAADAKTDLEKMQVQRSMDLIFPEQTTKSNPLPQKDRSASHPL
jgi:hypothetical protein